MVGLCIDGHIFAKTVYFSSYSLEEEEEERRGTKSKFSGLVFSTLLKVSGLLE